MMEQAHWSQALNRMGADVGYANWARRDRSPTAAWRACRRGDWMAWHAGQVAGEPWSDQRRPLVLALVGCVDTVLYTADGYDLTAAAIGVLRQWAMGDDTISPADVERVGFATSCYDFHLIGSGWRATCAAVDATAAGAKSRDLVGDLAEVCVIHVAHSVAGRCDRRALARCADILREHYPVPPGLL